MDKCDEEDSISPLLDLVAHGMSILTDIKSDKAKEECV